MVISDLSYSEVVSEGFNIVGGKIRIRTNQTVIKQKAKITIIGSGSASIIQTSSVVTSNDDL